MRLAVYTDYRYYRRDGRVYSERAFAIFLAALAPHLDRLIVLGRLHPEPEPSRYALGESTEFVGLPYYRSLGRPGRTVIPMLGALRRFWRVLGDVDAVLLFGPHPLTLAFAMLAALRGRRLIIGVRQDYPTYVARRYPDRRAMIAAGAAMEACFRALSRVVPTVVVGPALASRYRHARRLLQIAASLVGEADVVPPRVALGRSYDGDLTALSVGRLEPEKNPLMLADVLARLRKRDPRWRLIVCGEGPMEVELAGRLRSLGLADHAELRGYIPLDAGLHEIYRQSHALLHVSWTEGLPQVLLEAFAAGLPVVATDVGGVSGFRDALRLVPPGDPDAVTIEASQIAVDEELRARLVETGNRYARKYTIESESRRVADFVSATTGDGAGGRSVSSRR
jgi:glycosyltransferase involved in cell wall biosynthesis